MTDDKYHHDPGHFRKTRVSPPWLSNTCFNARSLFETLLALCHRTATLPMKPSSAMSEEVTSI